MGCGVYSATHVVTVNGVPDAGVITGASEICVGSASTLTDAAFGGFWNSTTPYATVSPYGIVTGISAGIATISYTVVNSCGSASAVLTLTINPLPDGGIITGPSTVCTGGTVTLMDGVPGGVWSSSGTGVATVGVTGVVTGFSAGTVTISYITVNVCGSAGATKIITVNSIPSAGIIAGLSSVCTGSAITLTDGTPGGTWSSSGPGFATVSATGIVSGLSAGVVTISYSVVNTCGSAAATKSVTVNSAPSVGVITGPSSVCTGSTIALTDGIAGGAWSSIGSGVATVDVTGIVTGISIGTVTISYTMINACGIIAAD